MTSAPRSCCVRSRPVAWSRPSSSSCPTACTAHPSAPACARRGGRGAPPAPWPGRAALRPAWRTAPRAGPVPGLDRLLSHAARRAFPPEIGPRLSVRGNPAARDLVRHAFADVGGNAGLARSWATFARAQPVRARRELLDVYARITAPTLLLWADRDPLHPLQAAEEALDLLPDAQLRVLSGTGFLIAYDDPVGVGRELTAFCA